MGTAYCEMCKRQLTNNLGNLLEDIGIVLDTDDQLLCQDCNDKKHHIHRRNCPTCGQEVEIGY